MKAVAVEKIASHIDQVVAFGGGHSFPFDRVLEIRANLYRQVCRNVKPFLVLVRHFLYEAVHGELIFLPKIKHFLALLLVASSPNLARHGESICCYRPHPSHDCQTAQTRRRKGSHLQKISS